MTKEEWIDKCAEHLHEYGCISMSEAIEYATTCYDAEEDINAPGAYTPEEVADEEMSLWDEPITLPMPIRHLSRRSPGPTIERTP